MTKDLAASVRARLLNIAKAHGTDFNQVLVRFALERMLYRLRHSMLTLWPERSLPPLSGGGCRFRLLCLLA